MTDKRVARFSRNLQRWLDKATPHERDLGECWYETASLQCWMLTSEGRQSLLDAVAGVVAALSPGMRWERNIDAARRLLLTGDSGVGYMANRRKARRIAAGEAPMDVQRGPKVRAFYTLLRDPTDAHALCLDSIAVLAALGRDPRRSITADAGKAAGQPRTMRTVDAAYRRVAAANDLLPHQLQAIVWVAFRNERDR